MPGHRPGRFFAYRLTPRDWAGRAADMVCCTLQRAGWPTHLPVRATGTLSAPIGYSRHRLSTRPPSAVDKTQMIPVATRRYCARMRNVVTAADLARMIGLSDKTVRARLRWMADAGHPLVTPHRHGEPWQFSNDAAKELARELGERPSRSRPQPGVAGAGARPVACAAKAASHRLITTSPKTACELNVREIPDEPGIYAWWSAPDALIGVMYRPHGPSTNDGLELVYIGIASSLRTRIGDHLGRHTGSSTRRRALGAWVGESEGWTTEGRARRLQHTPESEDELTAWISTHLSLTWGRHDSPVAVEGDVVAILGPPLKFDHNKAHPNYPRVA
jgi:hypothetical protein